MYADKQYDAGVLSEGHAKLLEWFFGQGRATFGRSTCGAIIDRLEMFAFGSDPCDACNGTGFRGGWSYGDEAHRKLHPVAELAALIGVQLESDGTNADLDAVCPSCRGSGVQARTTARPRRLDLTARPRSLSGEGQGYTPTDFALQHYAAACRRLEVVSTRSERACQVLEAFYGDWGGRWADTTEGRLFAVYVFTNAGHKLLRMADSKAKSELRPDEILGTEFELQRVQPNTRRRDLFTAAREQAKRLLEQAHRAWNTSESERDVRNRVAREAKAKAKRDARIRQILDAAERGMPFPDPIVDQLFDESQRRQEAQAGGYS